MFPLPLFPTPPHIASQIPFSLTSLAPWNDSIYIGKHSDNLENLVIVTISLGAERSWIMERKPPRKGSKAALEIKGQSLEKKRWKLGNGSLLVMQGDSQKDWKHEIPKELKVKDKRIVSQFFKEDFDFRISKLKATFPFFSSFLVNRVSLLGSWFIEKGGPLVFLDLSFSTSGARSCLNSISSSFHSSFPAWLVLSIFLILRRFEVGQTPSSSVD